MKKSIVTFLMLTFVYAGMYAQQKQISYIKTDGTWYQVYDESGKKVTTVSKQSVGKVVGWGSNFFVSVDGAWIKVYDITGKKTCTISKQSAGEVIGVSGNTFTCRDGSWIKIYDKTDVIIETKGGLTIRGSERNFVDIQNMGNELIATASDGHIYASSSGGFSWFKRR